MGSLVQFVRWVRGLGAVDPVDAGEFDAVGVVSAGELDAVDTVDAGEPDTVGAVDMGNEWGGRWTVCGVGLCARESSSRRSS